MQLSDDPIFKWSCLSSREADKVREPLKRHPDQQVENKFVYWLEILVSNPQITKGQIDSLLSVDNEHPQDQTTADQELPHTYVESVPTHPKIKINVHAYRRIHYKRVTKEAVGIYAAVACFTSIEKAVTVIEDLCMNGTLSLNNITLSADQEWCCNRYAYTDSGFCYAFNKFYFK